MIIQTEQREKLFKEIELLKKAGVSIRLERDSSCRDPRDKETGYAKLSGSAVLLLIKETDPLELTIDNIVKAGELVDVAAQIDSYERNHPDFFTALSRRLKQD